MLLVLLLVAVTTGVAFVVGGHDILAAECAAIGSPDDVLEGGVDVAVAAL